MLKLLTLALMGLSLVSLPSRADWGTIQGGPVGSGYVWLPNGPEYALCLNGHQIGVLRVEDRAYFALLPGDQWKSVECPCELPAGLPPKGETCPNVCGCGCHETGRCTCGPHCACSCGCGKSGNCSCGSGHKVQTHPCNYGVDSSKIHKGDHHINGMPCTKEQLISAIKDVPHDQDRPRLTLIAPEPALGILRKILAPFAQEHGLVFQAYPPDSWAITGAGFKTDTDPVVYLQQPNGKVLLRLDHFTGQTDGPLVETVRKLEPSYDPAKDPTGTSDPIQSILNTLRQLPGEVWAAILTIFYLYTQKKGV